MICPGCGKEMDQTTPMKTLAAISAHEVFCRPPGVVDHLMAREGIITERMALWVGRSIETMIRALGTG